MGTDLSTLADAAVSFGRQAREFSSTDFRPDAGPDAGAPPNRDRLRAARQLREGSRHLISHAENVAEDWIAFVMERRYTTREEETSALDQFIATCDRAVSLIAAGRSLWAAHQTAGGKLDLTAELDQAERRFTNVRRLAAEDRDRVTRPWQPPDPERFAEAMRPDREVKWVSAEDAIARFRAERKGQ